MTNNKVYTIDEIKNISFRKATLNGGMVFKEYSSLALTQEAKQHLPVTLTLE